LVQGDVPWSLASGILAGDKWVTFAFGTVDFILGFGDTEIPLMSAPQAFDFWYVIELVRLGHEESREG